MANIMIEVDQIYKKFHTQQVLHGMSFHVGEGEIVGLLGPNGSGKTTMIRLLNGVITPDQGKMHVGGFDPAINGGPIRQMSGILTEGAGLYHELSGLENLNFFAKIYGIHNNKRLIELLEKFDLQEHMHKPVGTYSTGMKKRLGLAKAILHQPRILFLDEPTNGLDPDGIHLVMGYLKELNRQSGTTILLCSHVLHQIETVCHSYVFMDKGEVIIQGTQKEIEQRYMKEIKLKVETNLKLNSNTYHHYVVESVGNEQIIFSLNTKDEIPELLRKVLAEADVFSTEILNRDLESLYFRIRGGENK